MSSVRYETRENRLARLLTEPGGLMRNEAVAAAQSNLTGIRGEILAEIDRRLAGLRGCVEAAAREPAELAARRETYVHANAIAGVAANAGLAGLGRAAFSLCELADRLIEAGAWNEEGVGLHLSAMALMRDPELSAGLRGQAVLDGLDEVVRKLTGVAKPEAGAET